MMLQPAGTSTRLTIGPLSDRARADDRSRTSRELFAMSRQAFRLTPLRAATSTRASLVFLLTEHLRSSLPRCAMSQADGAGALALIERHSWAPTYGGRLMATQRVLFGHFSV
jgi:hypothetical protein